MKTTQTAKTPAQLQAWVSMNRPMVRRLKTARDHAAAERARVDAYTGPIFERFSFDGIASPDQLYLCDDEPKVEAFFAALDQAHRDHGFTGPEGYCPALVAEESCRKAEQALLNSLGDFLGLDGRDFNRTMDLRARALGIIMDTCEKL